MTYNKITQLIDKDDTLLTLFGGMLIVVILMIALVVYAGLQLAG